MKKFFKALAIIISVLVVILVLVAVGGAYWGYTRMLSQEPLDLEKVTLSLLERQSLNARLLPVQQAYTRNKSLDFKVKLSSKETTYILQEALDSSVNNALVKVELEENSVFAFFTKRILMRRYLNVELEGNARVRDSKYQIDFESICMGSVCLADSMLGQASHFLEWRLEKRLNSEDSRFVINELYIKKDLIECRFSTQEVHPPDIEESTEEQAKTSLKP